MIPVFQFHRIPGVNPVIVLAVLLAPVIYVALLAACIVLVLYFVARLLTYRLWYRVRLRRLDTEMDEYLTVQQLTDETRWMS